jgi:hypothetical protein
MQELAVQRVPHLGDLAFLDGGQHRALRLDQVAAVVELAVPR